ncbi:hypothetical protein [Sporosalibacterium faouarense]|uniref:hypothetical protein n=1 Tax=Sporosalibacterium faouarense TaxID=516123 RepID=UPI00141C2BDC|nr:hypothetical protein [Sporosalibacterium faouarense]MTI47363.1 hypothetical protein [Bacillota bacterium]
MKDEKIDDILKDYFSEEMEPSPRLVEETQGHVKKLYYKRKRNIKLKVILLMIFSGLLFILQGYFLLNKYSLNIITLSILHYLFSGVFMFLTIVVYYHRDIFWRFFSLDT